MQQGDEYEAIDAGQWLPPDEDLLTDARKARGDTTTVETDRGGTETRAFDRPLMFYFLRGHITRRQYRAGHRYYALWHYSVLRVRYVRMKYGEPAGEVDLESIALAPKEYLEAQAAITDPRGRAVVYAVCCEGGTAGKRGGMKLLTDGLDQLAAFFRIE